LSRDETVHHSVQHDLLFRWAVECLVALGMQFDYAFTISQELVRTCERKGSTEPIERLTCELARMRGGSLSTTPDHQLNQLSESSLSVRVRNGHAVLALHDAVEFARHAAVLHGWGAVSVHEVDCPGAAETYLAVNVRDGLAGLAVAEGTDGSARITAAFANAGGGGELFDVPVLLLLEAKAFGAAYEVPGIGGLVSAFLGIPVGLAQDFSKIRPQCVQLLAADAERFGASILKFRAKLQEHHLVGCRPKNLADETSASRILPVDHDLRCRMKLWSRRLDVFDPFA